MAVQLRDDGYSSLLNIDQSRDFSISFATKSLSSLCSPGHCMQCPGDGNFYSVLLVGT